MSQTRNWTQYEDKILKYIRDQQGIQKWSTIAQKMAQQYGIKGRNGKQCKQRYMEVFDENKQVLHWDYQTQQMMFLLHDKYGNKWAAIGQQLNNRTDNDVKNHFYSKIRKGLRKINYIVKDHFKQQIKQIKQTVLYKIVEGAEDRFSPQPLFDSQIWNYCTQAKNCLLRMSYDEQKYNPWQNFQQNFQQIKEFIENLYLFSKDFQRKPRLNKKNQQGHQYKQNEGIQTTCKIPYQNGLHSNQISACDSQIESSQFDESHNTESEKMIMNINQLPRTQNPVKRASYLDIPQQPQLLTRKSQKVNPVIILKSSNQLSQMMQEKCSIDLTKKMDIRNQKQQNNLKQSQSLLPSIPKLFHISSKASNAMIDQQEQDMNMNCHSDKNIEMQLIKDGLLQQEDDKNSPQFLLFNGSGSKKITSKGSNFSSYSMDEQQCGFFGEDSTLNMRIFTTGIGGKMPHQMYESLQKSDKLFKSLQRSGKLFESIGSRGQKQMKMSIERSIDLNKSNPLAQSVGK